MAHVTTFVPLVLVAVLSGCVVDPGYRHYPDRGYGYDGDYDRQRYDDAWDVVRRDPCRLEEYRRFAERHKNPDKRRRFIEQLARDGCSERIRRSYYPADDAWDVVRRDPCRRAEYERFAQKHKNPNKRRQFIERLAREGCSRAPYDDYDPYR